MFSALFSRLVAQLRVFEWILVCECGMPLLCSSLLAFAPSWAPNSTNLNGNRAATRLPKRAEGRADGRAPKSKETQIKSQRSFRLPFARHLRLLASKRPHDLIRVFGTNSRPTVGRKSSKWPKPLTLGKLNGIKAANCNERRFGLEFCHQKLLSTMEQLRNTKLRLFVGTTGRIEPKRNNLREFRKPPFSPLKSRVLELVLSANRRGISGMSIGSGNGRMEGEWGRIKGESEIIPPNCRLCEKPDRPAGNAQADCPLGGRAASGGRVEGDAEPPVGGRLFRTTARWPNRQPLHQNA